MLLKYATLFLEYMAGAPSQYMLVRADWYEKEQPQ